jgi:hypothetical protein
MQTSISLDPRLSEEVVGGCWDSSGLYRSNRAPSTKNQMTSDIRQNSRNPQFRRFRTTFPLWSGYEGAEEVQRHMDLKLRNIIFRSLELIACAPFPFFVPKRNIARHIAFKITQSGFYKASV